MRIILSLGSPGLIVAISNTGKGGSASRTALGRRLGAKLRDRRQTEERNECACNKNDASIRGEAVVLAPPHQRRLLRLFSTRIQYWNSSA